MESSALPVCHVLYVTGTRVSDVLSAVHEAPVLTVSDGARFSRGGGIIQLIPRDTFRVGIRWALPTR